MERKRYNILNKLLIVVIALCMLTSIHTIVFAEQYELSEGSEMDILINSLQDWYSSNIGASESEFAKQIVDVCGGDLNKIKKLQDSYTIDNIPIWNGSNREGSQAKAVDIAIESVQNNTEIKEGNFDDQKKLSKEISDMAHIAYDNNASTEDLKKLDAKLAEYRDKYGFGSNDTSFRDMANKIRDKLNSKGETGQTTADQIDNRDQERDEYEASKPSTGTLGSSSTASTSHTPDEIITEANQFIEQASGTTIRDDQLNSASSTLYNILLSIGIFLAVAIGMYLGIKFMISTAEDKAKVKEALIPYIAGCVVIFSAFIIWKFAILLLGGIA